MTEKPQVDFEEVVKASGMPVTESEVRDRFNAIAADEGIITNTSRMSPFWRLITAIVTAPVMWLKDVLVFTVLANMFVATASGSMLRLLAWAVNVTAKPASAAQGVIRFFKEDARAVVTVKAGTIIQTERISCTLICSASVNVTSQAIFPSCWGASSIPLNVASRKLTARATSCATRYF